MDSETSIDHEIAALGRTCAEIAIEQGFGPDAELLGDWEALVELVGDVPSREQADAFKEAYRFHAQETLKDREAE